MFHYVSVRGALGQNARNHAVVAFKRDQDPAQSTQVTIMIQIDHLQSNNLVTI